MKEKKWALLLVLALIVVLTFSSFIQSFQQESIVNPGWEIYNQIAGITYGQGVKTGPGDFPHPVTIGGANWIVDEDELYWGSPTLMVQTSEIRHVDFTGTVIPSSQPATAPIEKVINNHKYVVDQHIYMFDVTVRTVADKITHASSLPYPFMVPKFSHETSWPVENSGAYSSGGEVGKQFNGGVYIKFVVSPWSGIASRETPEGYYLNGAWAGIMDSKIFTKEQGQVANQWGEIPIPDAEAPMFVRGGLDNGAQINMYEDGGGFGTPADTIDWDPNQVLDSRIQSVVVLYLPEQLQAGAYLKREVIPSDVTQLTPCDVYIKYTVKVDILQAHDYVLVTNPIPDELDPPVDFFSWVKGFWDGLFNTSNPWLWITLALIIIVVIVFLLKKPSHSGESPSSDTGSGLPSLGLGGGGGEGGNGGGTFSLNKKFAGLKWYHWGVIGTLVLLGVIPDPTDLLDFGLPILEPVLAGVYYLFVRPKGGKS